MIKPATKKFKLLEWMSKRNGTRYSDITRFICEMNGLDYDEKDCNGSRIHKGIWGTNLCSGSDAILHNYCRKINGLWHVTYETRREITQLTSAAPVKSSLENVKASDEISGNSKPISVEYIKMHSEPTLEERIARNLREIRALSKEHDELLELAEKTTTRLNAISASRMTLRNQITMMLDSI